jgi:hypothetical protein
MLQGVVPAMPNGTAGAVPQTSHDGPTDNSSADTTTGPGVLPNVRSLHLARCYVPVVSLHGISQGS